MSELSDPEDGGFEDESSAEVQSGGYSIIGVLASRTRRIGTGAQIVFRQNSGQSDLGNSFSQNEISQGEDHNGQISSRNENLHATEHDEQELIDKQTWNLTPNGTVCGAATVGLVYAGANGAGANGAGANGAGVNGAGANGAGVNGTGASGAGAADSEVADPKTVLRTQQSESTSGYGSAADLTPDNPDAVERPDPPIPHVLNSCVSRNSIPSACQSIESCVSSEHLQPPIPHVLTSCVSHNSIPSECQSTESSISSEQLQLTEAVSPSTCAQGSGSVRGW